MTCFLVAGLQVFTEKIQILPPVYLNYVLEYTTIQSKRNAVNLEKLITLNDFQKLLENNNLIHPSVGIPNSRV